MARPRLTVRKLILIVAGLAILLAIVAHESKRRRLRYLGNLVASYAEREAYWTNQEKAMRRSESQELKAGNPSTAAISASQAIYDQEQARYYGTLRRKYEEALRRPEGAVEPDPMAPSLFPRDYLSSVPYYVPDRANRGGSE
jgi:hypothetical protein